MFRKLIVAGVIAMAMLLAALPELTRALEHSGLIPLARDVRAEYLTGTAIAVIVVLLILLPTSGRVIAAHAPRRCPVCDHPVRNRGRYCPACGSRVVG